MIFFYKIVTISKKKEFGKLANSPRSAESEGFEPPDQLPGHRISSAARSTTPATFQNCGLGYILSPKITPPSNGGGVKI